MRLIQENETPKLLDCLEELAKHHNEESKNLKGSFPNRPFDETIDFFKKSLKSEVSKIAVKDDGDDIAGFCKVDIEDDEGTIDYLIVLPEYQGKGYGEDFMEWAMKEFEKANVDKIELKVIAGNSTIKLYEKYGFKIKSHIIMLEK